MSRVASRRGNGWWLQMELVFRETYDFELDEYEFFHSGWCALCD